MAEYASFRADEKGLETFRRSVDHAVDTERESPGHIMLTPYDTFDWRLYKEGLFAYKTQDSFVVSESFTGPPRAECETADVPRFWWEFDEGETRGLLKGITGIRALLPLADLELEEERFSLRNRDGKIVCRAFSLTHQPGGGERRSYLVLRFLRGYPEEYDSMRSLARRSGMEELSVDVSEDLLLANGIRPGDYSSKIDIELDRGLTGSQAAMVINRRLLATIRANLEGIIQDYDTEFLHDFRVATRRTRACLSELKGSLPRDRATSYNKAFKAAAQCCNVLRDLDVYLLGKDDYFALLPPSLHPGLNEYFRYVKRKRSQHHRDFSSFIQSEEFGALLKDWECFLDDPSALVDDRPAIEVAGARILDRFQRIIKKGRKIKDASPDDKLHRLRIECKKLRYMLEFFRSYYPDREMRTLIRHLKDFQDNLGEFNDLTVQQDDLNAYLERSREASRFRNAAIGGLITALNNRQLRVRNDFHRRFEDFDSKENRSLYRELFSPEG